MPNFDDPPPLNKTNPPITGPTRSIIILLQRSIYWLARHWLLLANGLAGLILGLGILAPFLLAQGHTEQGLAVYRFLAPHNHQLPQRSYFLFSQHGGIHTYSVAQILAWGADPDHLQAFVGNPDIGFKTALNHRMMAIFVAIFVGGIAWEWGGRRPRIDGVLFLLFLLPLLLDGFSHTISERTGSGFRGSNIWAATLTGHLFSTDFYTNTTIGTLNWLLRTLTGLLFGLGLVWFLYAYLALRFQRVEDRLEPRLRRLGVIK